MMSKNADKKREQLQIFSMDDMVPKDHLLRSIDRAIDWNFIYELVEDKYSQETGRPSMDPVMLIKIPFVQYLYGIKSMRQTIKEIEVNVAYRWFLGLSMFDPVPHFSTFSKNYTRRFKDTSIFEQIFARILGEAIDHKLVDPSIVFVDATHVKACANNHKMQKQLVAEEALFYEETLKKEINEDRITHGKKPLKTVEATEENAVNDKDQNDKDNDDSNDGGAKTLNTEGREKEDLNQKNIKEIKSSISDPESGWFRKGEHKHVFAYAIETACDKHGWILNYTIHPGNFHDSRTFPELYEKLKNLEIDLLVADAGYKTPAIAKLLIDDQITPVFPYKRPMTKEGYFKKYEYVYDEYYDCYLCPHNQILAYSTTNRDGYKEYKSKGYLCKKCPDVSRCTGSKDYTKLITRHVWEEYMEKCEDIRHTKGIKELYSKRKETIERIFGTAKENHGFRYTNMKGKARMQMKVGLTFACMNLKKLAKFKQKMHGLKRPFFIKFNKIYKIYIYGV